MPSIVPFVDHEIGYELLRKLVAHCRVGKIRIPAVVTTIENGSEWWPGVREICSTERLPLLLYDEQLSCNQLLEGVDWFLLLSWKHLLSANLFKLPRQASINLHYSLLPSYRGVYPVNWAIVNGEKKSGFTYHFVDEKIDEGEILMQIEVPVRLDDTARTLQSRIDNEVCNHFDDFLDQLVEGNFRVQSLGPIAHQMEKSSYYSKEKFENTCHVDLEKMYRGEDFLNLLRGLTFFENSRIAYIIDSESKKKIFLSVNLVEEE